MTRLELADRTGVIGGGPPKPLPIRPDAIIPPLGPLHKPPRASPVRLSGVWCNVKNTPTWWTGRTCPARFACRECEPCREWRVFKLMVRYRHGRSPEQTRVWMWGFENVDVARQWATAQGKRCGGRRVTLICRGTDYLFECLTIYAEPINEKGQMLTHLAICRTRRIGDINTGPFTPDEFQALVPRDALRKGAGGRTIAAPAYSPTGRTTKPNPAITWRMMATSKLAYCKLFPNLHPSPGGHFCVPGCHWRNEPPSTPPSGAKSPPLPTT